MGSLTIWLDSTPAAVTSPAGSDSIKWSVLASFGAGVPGVGGVVLADVAGCASALLGLGGAAALAGGAVSLWKAACLFWRAGGI